MTSSPSCPPSLQEDLITTIIFHMILVLWPFHFGESPEVWTNLKINHSMGMNIESPLPMRFHDQDLTF